MERLPLGIEDSAAGLESALAEIEAQFGRPRSPLDIAVDNAMAAIYEADPMPPRESDEGLPMTDTEWQEHCEEVAEDEDAFVPRELVERTISRRRWLKRVSQARTEVRKNLIRRDVLLKGPRRAVAELHRRRALPIRRSIRRASRIHRRARRARAPARSSDDPSPTDLARGQAA